MLRNDFRKRFYAIKKLKSKRDYENVDNPTYKKFVDIYQSQEVKDFINKTYDGEVVAAW